MKPHLPSEHHCVQALFEAQVEDTPDKIALVFDNQKISYQELNARSNQIAHYLRKLNIGPGSLVGVSMERSPDVVISIMGIIKSGGAYVPLDPYYPKDRLVYIINDSNLSLILSDNRSNKELSKLSSIKDIQNINSPEIFQQSKHNPNRLNRSENLVYVMYTSGSTGKPKGVMITHFNLYHFVKFVPTVLNVTKNDICLQTASINYALSVRQFFVPLCHGARIVIANSNQMQNPKMLFELIKAQEVTMIDFVPSHWRTCNHVLINLNRAEREKLIDNNLRQIVSVGEPLLSNIPIEWKKYIDKNTRLINILGQTETTGLIAYYHIPDMIDKSLAVVPVGKNTPNTNLYLLDNNLEPVKDGEVGELYVNSPCVGSGYLNLPDLTSEKFVPNPFSDQSATILYKTGDLARRLSNDNFVHLGRSDQQIKIRGIRIELGEIESVLGQHPLVKQAVVVSKKSELNENILIAFLLIDGDQDIERKEYREFLSQKLPPHLIPVAFVKLKEFPLSPNGKIDRNALPMPKLSALKLDSNYIAAKNITEKKLTQIWEDILNIKPIGIKDNFFDSGGSSLVAVELFLEIEKAFNKTIPISILSEAPTIEKLALIIEGDDKLNDIGSSLIAIQPNGSRPPFFCIHGAGGNVLIYRDLARHLGKDQPFYGLQSQGLDGNQPLLETIEQMALKYIDEIRKRQPVGPYYLGGYCMGGTVALEIAHQLTQQDQEVALLAMFETFNWAELPPRSRLQKLYFQFQRIEFHILNMFFLSTNRKKLFFIQKAEELIRRLKIWFKSTKFRLKGRGSESNKQEFRRALIWKMNDKAAFQYKPKKYSGKILLFLPFKRFKVHNVPGVDWNNMAAEGTEKIIIPVYPRGMLVEPFVKTLAEKLRERIQETLLELNKYPN